MKQGQIGTWLCSWPSPPYFVQPVFFIFRIFLHLPPSFLKRKTEVGASHPSPVPDYVATLAAAAGVSAAPFYWHSCSSSNCNRSSNPVAIGAAAAVDDRVTAYSDSAHVAASLFPYVGHPVGGVGLQPLIPSSSLPFIHRYP